MSDNANASIALNDLPACPVETTLTLISDKWNVLILRDLIWDWGKGYKNRLALQ